MHVLRLLFIPMIVFAAAATRAGEPSPTVAELRAAVEKALPLLRTGAAGHMAERKCFACHSQTMPVLAMREARRIGLEYDEEHVAEHVKFILASLEKGRERYADGTGQGGNVITAGHALWTLELADHPADDVTKMVVDYLIGAHAKDEHWRVTPIRPPAEGSHFSPTFVALRAVEHYGDAEQKARLVERSKKVLKWLETTPSKDNEDRVFRLWSLAQIGAAPEVVQSAADELLTMQRDDGGWAQLDDGDPKYTASDVYATATALVALHEAAGLQCVDEAYCRGLRFLLDAQQADGSWHVKSRSKPIQTYYDAGYPHEKDQFLSIAAAGWATTALALACPDDQASSKNSSSTAAGPR